MTSKLNCGCLVPNKAQFAYALQLKDFNGATPCIIHVEYCKECKENAIKNGRVALSEEEVEQWLSNPYI